MPTSIKIDLGGIVLTGELYDNPAGCVIGASLPFSASLSRWGEEYYGSTNKSFGHPPGDATEEMSVGDLAYHGETGWFCIFFGPTPVSHGKEPRAAVPVIKVGQVSGDWPRVKELGDSVKARMSAA